MIQSAFVDMESMFDLLTEEKEVSASVTALPDGTVVLFKRWSSRLAQVSLSFGNLFQNHQPSRQFVDTLSFFIFDSYANNSTQTLI